MSLILEKIKTLNLILPQPPKPAGSYHPVLFSGHAAFLSGQLSRKSDGTLMTGKAGRDLNLEQAQEAARQAALNVISIIHHLVGHRFSRLLRVSGYVQTMPDFYDISSVMNGASDLFLAVLGENGIHARTSVGMSSLPLNAAVEIEATLEVRD